MKVRGDPFVHRGLVPGLGGGRRRMRGERGMRSEEVAGGPG